MIRAILLIVLFVQTETKLKPSREFEIKTNYQLKAKPNDEPNKVIVDKAESKRSNSDDALPYLSINLKVKSWHPDATHIKIVDSKERTILRKKAGDDDAVYNFDIGFIDDIKDKLTSGKFFILFTEDKKPIEQITITVEEDGTFLVNGEKRGKF